MELYRKPVHVVIKFDECYYARIMNHIAGEHEQQDYNNYVLLFGGVRQIFIYDMARFHLPNVHIKDT